MSVFIFSTGENLIYERNIFLNLHLMYFW